VQIIHHNLPIKKLAAHAHAEHHLFIPLQGEIKVETKSEKYIFGPGKALFLPSNTLHSFSSTEIKDDGLKF